ncbi:MULTISPECIES: ATP-binding protein [unclassified Streptomyces]|uniref:ATP-binding protein n=1 Tax=unclassified Streptomyces TaxID=2593676 RepID=UPI0031BB4EE5
MVMAAQQETPRVNPLSRDRFYLRTIRAVAGARGFTRATLEEWKLDGRTEDIVQCVSELAANAVLHGVPPGRGFLLRLVCVEDGLRIEVHDSGRRMPQPPQTNVRRDGRARAGSRHGPLGLVGRARAESRQGRVGSVQPLTSRLDPVTTTEKGFPWKQPIARGSTRTLARSPRRSCRTSVRPRC